MERGAESVERIKHMERRAEERRIENDVSVKDYKDLDVYRLAFDTAMEIFEISKTFPQDEKYSLTDQMRRSSRSVCANIAEAWRKRRYEAAFVSKLSDADTEAAETEVWLDFALKCGYIQETVHKKLRDKYDHICRQLYTMMKDAPSWCRSFSSLNAPRSTLHASRASGFSLVEVTLALMVMAIGILSIISLFPAGLDQNARSIADTHAAFFAEEVFGGLQAYAETNWAGLDQPSLTLSIAAATNWHQSGELLNTILTSGLTNKYIRTDNTNYMDHAFRYRLVVTNAVGNGLLKAATLFVWPGEFGSTNDPSMFYAEFFRWKPL